MTLSIFDKNSPEVGKLITSITELLKENSLYRRNYGEITTKLLKIINTNNAIIAGGAVLASINNNNINDLDIYVNIKDSQKLINDLVILGYKISYSHSTPVYDKSFMLRNNVVGRLVYEIYKKNTFLEIMLVKDNTSLEDVVENFDLTFCKIWTNGVNIYTHYMDDIESKSGKLGEDYLKALLEGNTFTIDRLKKYTQRGYSIEYPNINTNTVSYKKHIKKVVSRKEWVIMYILKNLKSFVNGIMKKHDFYISFEAYALSILETESDPMQRWIKLLEIVNTVYAQSFDDNFTLPIAINGLIMFNIQGYLDICDWKSPHYLEYFNDFNIKIAPNSSSHGYNGENWDFCYEFYQDLEDKLAHIDVYALYQTFTSVYPNLEIAKDPVVRPLTATERMRLLQDEMRANAARFGEGIEIEEVDEATGMYRTSRGDEIPARCFSIMDAGEINSNSWENEEGNIFIIVEFGPDQSPDVVCTSVDEIEMMINDSSKLMYRCSGLRGSRAGHSLMVDDVRTLDGPYDLSLSNIDRSVKYVPFTYGFEGTSALIGYLPMKDINTLILIARNSTEVSTVTVRFVDTITHTIGVDTADERGSHIGANHCQFGSAISVFELQDTYSANLDVTPSTPPPRRLETTDMLPPRIIRMTQYSSGEDSGEDSGGGYSGIDSGEEW